MSKQPRVIALAVIMRDGRIFAQKGYDPARDIHYYRPLGGGVEYGEYARDAVVRELKEEVNQDITDVELLGTVENIFTLRGEIGHEIVYLYSARFMDEAAYGVEEIHSFEADGLPLHAAWVSLAAIERGEALLFPKGLPELLKEKLAVPA
jgi:ADP-ribose pyrophosphatase YjhB (NUDIX family)